MPFNSSDRPRLRNVDPIPVVVNGRQAVALKDPLQISEETLYVHADVLPILAMLDGSRSLLDIQADLTRRSGRLVYMDDIKTLLERLDEACLFAGERFSAAFQAKVAEYRRSPFRPSSHAGSAYSGDPAALREELTGYFTDEGGPGMPEFFSEEHRAAGLIAPHIDIRAGGRCFAQGYHALAAAQPSDVYVIFGTGHCGVNGVFTATNLDFTTPLGRTRTNRDFLFALEQELGRDPAAEEILHATEHVIEFQVVFLQFMFGGRHEFTIVPILCSLSHHIFGDSNAFRQHRELFHEYCAALKAVIRKSGRSVCFIASADLDHMGPRYGDGFVPHQGTINEALDKDKEMLGFLERMDRDGFVRAVARDNDSRRICGFSPITAMLHTMDAGEARLLGLDHARVDQRNSFVSFSSMIFY